MLSREQNALLTDVGPGTGMGALMRRYWLPALLSEELPQAGGRPIRLRLLDEDLVAFRSPSGAVGILEEHCAHRQASLYYGRNENEGLRCVYHGWQYDLCGQCIDMPNEPAGSRFKDHIQLTAYPTVERNGMVWVYMGPDEAPGEPPHLEWTLLSREQSCITKRVQLANWLQVLEGGIDSSHGSILHAYYDPSKRRPGGGRGANRLSASDKAPIYEMVDTEYGFMAAARRVVENQYFWRVYQLLYPFYTMVPSGPDSSIEGHAFVPRDNQTTIVWSTTWHPTRPLQHVDLFEGPGNTFGSIHTRDFAPEPAEPDGRWFVRPSRANDYLMDDEAQRTLRFSGIPGTPTQDMAMQDSMGAIVDRTKEHLGAADGAIAHGRRRYLELALRASDNVDHSWSPPGVREPRSYAVRSFSLLLDREESWAEHAEKIRESWRHEVGEPG